MGQMAASNRIYRLAYESRTDASVQREAVIGLVANAVRNNRRRAVSGVLFSGRGAFTQWLEGPEDSVCNLMARIAADPRHSHVRVLGAGWMSRRRYRNWPMRLVETDAPHPDIAFDAVAEAHRQEAAAYKKASPQAAFAQSLIHLEPGDDAVLPSRAMKDFRARARFVDGVCEAFFAGWRDDVWSGADIAIGMARLFRLWQSAGRAPDPIGVGRTVALVVPPESSEMLGATVKADLFRTAGVAVQTICETSQGATMAALASCDANAALVTGSRVGWSADQMRAEALVGAIGATFPDLPVRIGGRSSCALADWPRRLRKTLPAPTALSANARNGLALTALAAVKRRRAASPGLATP